MDNNSSFDLNILTPKGLVLEEKAFFLKLPTSEGEVSILPSHSPSLFQLNVGECVLSYDKQDTDAYFFIVRGYAHVTLDKVIVLTPFLEFLKDIDYNRAKKSEKRAIDRLNSVDNTIDKERAQISLTRAQKRIHLVDYYRN